jgi:hypothetical protein
MKTLLTLSLFSLVAARSFAASAASNIPDLYTTNQTFESESLYRHHLENLSSEAKFAESGKLLIGEYEVPELTNEESQKCLKKVIQFALAGTEFADLTVLTTHGSLSMVPGPKRFFIVPGPDVLVVRKDKFDFTATDSNRRRYRGMIRAEVHGKTIKDGTTEAVKRRLISCKLRLEHKYYDNDEFGETTMAYGESILLVNDNEKAVLQLGSPDFRKREANANSQK